MIPKPPMIPIADNKIMILRGKAENGLDLQCVSYWIIASSLNLSQQKIFQLNKFCCKSNDKKETL